MVGKIKKSDCSHSYLCSWNYIGFVLRVIVGVVQGDCGKCGSDSEMRRDRE